MFWKGERYGWGGKKIGLVCGKDRKVVEEVECWGKGFEIGLKENRNVNV